MKKQQVYKPWHIILDPNPETNVGGLWLGDYSAALDKKSIKAANIRTIITAATGLRVSYPSTYSHTVFQLYDSAAENITRYFQEAFDIIQKGLEKGNVYIHCFAGVSRSATIVISYLMRKFGWGLNQAYTFTKNKRTYIDPNPGFIRQLRKLQKQLNQELKQSKTNSNRIDKTPTKLTQSAVYYRGHVRGEKITIGILNVGRVNHQSIGDKLQARTETKQASKTIQKEPLNNYTATESNSLGKKNPFFGSYTVQKKENYQNQNSVFQKQQSAPKKESALRVDWGVDNMGTIYGNRKIVNANLSALYGGHIKKRSQVLASSYFGEKNTNNNTNKLHD